LVGAQAEEAGRHLGKVPGPAYSAATDPRRE
jgi:hypothetical protein